jgi:hypothetical protein
VWKMVPSYLLWYLWGEKNEKHLRTARDVGGASVICSFSLYTWTAAFVAP